LGWHFESRCKSFECAGSLSGDSEEAMAVRVMPVGDAASAHHTTIIITDEQNLSRTRLGRRWPMHIIFLRPSHGVRRYFFIHAHRNGNPCFKAVQNTSATTPRSLDPYPE
jgi:hypothetical protein